MNRFGIQVLFWVIGALISVHASASPSGYLGIPNEKLSTELVPSKDSTEFAAIQKYGIILPVEAVSEGTFWEYVRTNSARDITNISGELYFSSQTSFDLPAPGDAMKPRVSALGRYRVVRDKK